MIFAVAMTFIDQTIVSIAAPKIQDELHLSSTGLQWAINSYLLALAAFFALGGRLSDILGARRMVIVGIVVFAVSSVFCGLTPTDGLATGWIIAFRALQGVGGAMMYPAALAIVVNSYQVQERGRALALFFGVAGGLTAVGPILGGYLTLWTWRAIFWVNVPVAVIALVLLAFAKPASTRVAARIDYVGLVLVTAGIGLSVFGFQQSSEWGWGNPLTGLFVGLGAIALVAFARYEVRTHQPLIDFSIFKNHAFLVDNVILGVSMMVFIPIFFFASLYGQIALGKTPTEASLTLLYFFAGFVVAAQIGGRMLDRGGARRPVVLGAALACVGLSLWSSRASSLDLGQQVWFIVMAGAGMGLLLGQANTDALNQAPSNAYGEATGITQTVRNYGGSLGLAVLGTIMISVFQRNLTSSLIAQHVPSAQAHHAATAMSSFEGSGGSSAAIPPFVRADFATATQAVLATMAGIMGFAFLVAVLRMPRGAHVSASDPAPVAAD
jgi:EmrB/QacA subfamily drug resistance transporter